MAVAGGKSVLESQFPEQIQSSTDQIAPEDKVGLAGMGPSETPSVDTPTKGKNGDGLGGEWEVVSEKDKSDTESDKGDKSSKLEAAFNEAESTFKEGQKEISEEERLDSIGKSLDPEAAPKKPRRIGYESAQTEEPGILNVPRKAQKLAKVSMEAMIRGFQKFEKMSEEEEKHNVAAWHNAIRP